MHHGVSSKLARRMFAASVLISLAGAVGAAAEMPQVLRTADQLRGDELERRASEKAAADARAMAEAVKRAENPFARLELSRRYRESVAEYIRLTAPEAVGGQAVEGANSEDGEGSGASSDERRQLMSAQLIGRIEAYDALLTTIGESTASVGAASGVSPEPAGAGAAESPASGSAEQTTPASVYATAESMSSRWDACLKAIDVLSEAGPGEGTADAPCPGRATPKQSSIGVGEAQALVGEARYAATAIRDLAGLLNNSTDPEAMLMGSQVTTIADAAEERAAQIEARESARGGHATLFAGSVFSLEGDGSWDNDLEVLAIVETGLFTPSLLAPFGKLDRQSRGDARYASRFRFDASISEVGAVDDDASGSDGDSGDDAMGGADTDPLVNPFASGGTIFRTNGQLETSLFRHDSMSIGLGVGAGLSSTPGDSMDFTNLQPRYFAGFVFRDEFRNGGRGRLFLGAAEDEIWKREVVQADVTFFDREFGRVILDGELAFALPGDSGTTVGGRLFADTPMSGNGPSDVRFTIFVQQDFTSFLKFFAPGSQSTN